MQQILDFIVNNPVLVGLAFTAIESALMPLIPIKWNGIALFVLNIVKIKYGKPPLVVVPLNPEQERALKIKTDMETAVNAMAKESAARRLVE